MLRCLGTPAALQPSKLGSTKAFALRRAELAPLLANIRNATASPAASFLAQAPFNPPPAPATVGARLHGEALEKARIQHSRNKGLPGFRAPVVLVHEPVTQLRLETHDPPSSSATPPERFPAASPSIAAIEPDSELAPRRQRPDAWLDVTSRRVRQRDVQLLPGHVLETDPWMPARGWRDP